ncbi:MAG: hypothetical protein MJ102_01415 [Clostridia bacterium]|nr:hypothetical protein [Clostridia bacterium]
MRKIRDFIMYLVKSRGFSLPRLIFTGIYIYFLVYSALTFTTSVGNYPIQICSFAGAAVCLVLLRRSLKLMFDRETRKKVSAVWEKVKKAAGKIFSGISKRAKKVLGLDRIRSRGIDEKDFIFRERRDRRHSSRRLRNPMRWSELEDNSERVRFIFIDYMLKNIRAGYRLKPSSTPDEISRQLAHEDDEKLLFDSYRAARYSGGREAVYDETVRILSDLGKDRKK